MNVYTSSGNDYQKLVPLNIEAWPNIRHGHAEIAHVSWLRNIQYAVAPIKLGKLVDPEPISNEEIRARLRASIGLRSEIEYDAELYEALALDEAAQGNKGSAPREFKFHTLSAGKAGGFVDEVRHGVGLFDGRHFKHRELSYAPKDMRARRASVYILTDRPDRVVPEFAAETDGILTDLQDISDARIAESAFYIWFSRAELALPSLRRIVTSGGLFAPPPNFGKPDFFEVSSKALESYNEAGRLLGAAPFMGWQVHARICQAVEMTRDLPGDFVEVGVMSGSTALTALTHMRNLGVHRRCWLLDTWEGFQYPTAQKSADMIWAGTHLMSKGPAIERVTALMSRAGHQVKIAGCEICEDPLPSEIESVALASVEVNLYEAVLASLHKLAPLMVRRGVIVAGDPATTPGQYGAFLALDEFLSSPHGEDFVSVRLETHYILIKI